MPRFKMKPGMGSDERFDLAGKRYEVHSGDTIEIPHSRDLGAGGYKYEALDPDPPEVVFDPLVPMLQVKARGQGGWWDVVNPFTGRPINDRALRYPEALELAGQPAADHETNGQENETNDGPNETERLPDETGEPGPETV